VNSYDMILIIVLWWGFTDRCSLNNQPKIS